MNKRVIKKELKHQLKLYHTVVIEYKSNYYIVLRSNSFTYNRDFKIYNKGNLITRIPRIERIINYKDSYKALW